MIILTVNNLRKHYGPEPVLDGVTFDIRPGERIGLVGPNGAGKTTLMKIIAGLEEADAGQCQRHASATLGYLEQHPQFESHATVWQVAQTALAPLLKLAAEAEAAAAEISAAKDPAARQQLERRFDRLHEELARHRAYHLDHKIERVLDGLGFAPEAYHQPVGQLSGGQQNRLLLAKLLLEEPDLMLLDEPSNHLDLEATEWLEGFLAESQQAMLVVSHDRYFLDKVTGHTLELFRGTVDRYKGNFSAYWRQKAERVEVERRTYEKQQTEIAKMEDFVRRNHVGQKHAQAEDRRKKLERIERVEPPRDIAAPPMGFPEPPHCGEIVLRVERLAKGFDRPLFEDLTFEIARGEKWGILGPNGSGKTTLLRCLLGQIEPDAGNVILGNGVRPGYFDQQLTGVADEELALDAIRPEHKEFVEQQRRDMLARFGVTGDLALQRVKSLSGGERNRVSLARLASADANFLILDEPTNHLDLWARDSLERALRSFDGTVLFVSHDRYFLNRVADHLLIVEPGRFRVIEGGYDLYLYMKQNESAESSTKQESASGARGAAQSSEKSAPAGRGSGRAENQTDNGRRRRRFPYRKVADLEQEIADRESRVEQLHNDLATPEVLRDGDRVKAAQAELQQQQAALERLYEHWEEAAEMNA